MSRITKSQVAWQKYLDRRYPEYIPDHIPNDQMAKYRALKRQRKCNEGKIKKREAYEKIRRKRNEGKDNC